MLDYVRCSLASVCLDEVQSKCRRFKKCVLSELAVAEDRGQAVRDAAERRHCRPPRRTDHRDRGRLLRPARRPTPLAEIVEREHYCSRLGYRESVLDPTVYLLHAEGKLQGAIAVEVDDLFNFGSSLHYQKMDELMTKYKFGKMIKARPDLSIKIRSIDPDRLAWGVMTDASFDNAGDGRSQGAFGVIAFHEDLQKGFRVPCSLITWRSGRIQRVVNSTLAAETQSLSKRLGELRWIMSVYNEITDPEFTVEQWEARMARNKVLAMVSDECSSDFKEALCMVDAKALYDHLSRESVGPSQDKRTGLEIQVIRQSMNSIRGKVKWVPHPQMAIDRLTKKNASMDSLDQLLDSGEYQVVEMAQALRDKKDERERLGYNRR